MEVKHTKEYLVELIILNRKTWVDFTNLLAHVDKQHEQEIIELIDKANNTHRELVVELKRRFSRTYHSLKKNDLRIMRITC